MTHHTSTSQNIIPTRVPSHELTDLATGALTVPQYMRISVASMFEANASPSKVQCTLRLKYAKDPVKLLEIPSLGVLRNHLRILRRSNPVIRRKVSTLEISDYVGESQPEESPLGRDMDVAELRHFVDLHDFGRYIIKRT